MSGEYKLIITEPSAREPLIDHGRHFSVNGMIGHTSSVPDDAVLTVSLLDSSGRVVRYARQTKKNSAQMWAYHPDLTAYGEELDPGREKLKKIGFAELMVKDATRPEESFRDATLKCWYGDGSFKSMIVSATDAAHGAAADDGIGLLDGDGEPYSALERGSYTIVAELCSREGETLASDSKRIVIGNHRDHIICRFNPRAHREKMTAWSEEIGITMTNDSLPGYLDPYIGRWQYHMGLLAMYRANDLAMYRGPKIHMFVYLIDPTSTSYETELAYLQSMGYVKDPERFAAYHYDIGEAVLSEGKENERRGSISEFEKNEYLHVYRIDTVNASAEENVYDLSGRAVVSHHTDTADLCVRAGEDIAVTGVVRPWQLDASDFKLRRDNIYDIANSVSSIKYVFSDGEREWSDERELMLERIDSYSIGRSVYEFYNIFRIGEALRGKTLTVTLTACDRRGENPQAKKTVEIKVI